MEDGAALFFSRDGGKLASNARGGEQQERRLRQTNVHDEDNVDADGYRVNRLQLLCKLYSR